MKTRQKRLSKTFLTAMKMSVLRAFPKFDLKAMLLTHRKWRSSSQGQLKNLTIFIKIQYSVATRLIRRQILPYSPLQTQTPLKQRKYFPKL